MTYAQYGSAYGSLADYFSQSGGTGSPGRAGGNGYNNDYSSSGGGYSYGGGAGVGGGRGGTSTGGSGQGTSTDSTQGGNASSGSGWISAAVSNTQSDKSQFITPFSQNFGGITNNQVINSPGAVGANAPQSSSPSASPIAPLVSAQGVAASPLMWIAIAFLAGALFLRR